MGGRATRSRFWKGHGAWHDDDPCLPVCVRAHRGAIRLLGFGVSALGQWPLVA